jgi:peptidyl-prolyl cis-trans isomerase SurA
LKQNTEFRTQKTGESAPRRHSVFGILHSVFLAVLLASVVPSSAAEIIDRIAVTVGKHAIKSSDIERDLRVTAFLNREPLNLNSNARRAAAERLIDQALISGEIADGGYTRPAESDSDALLNRIRRERSGGSDARLREALATYGITEDQIRQQLLWQLEVLRFIDQRFRSGVLVTDDDVRSYYDQHRADLARQNPKAQSLEDLEPKIRQSLEGERINQNFAQWLEEARRRSRIQYHQEAFG